MLKINCGTKFFFENKVTCNRFYIFERQFSDIKKLFLTNNDVHVGLPFSITFGAGLRNGQNGFKGFHKKRPLQKSTYFTKQLITRDSRMHRASWPSSRRLSVCPSVHHTRKLYQNGAS